MKQPQPQHRQPMMAASLGSDSSDGLHAGAANPAPAAAPSAAPEGARTEAAAAPAPAQAPAGAKTEAAGGFVTTQGTNFVLNGEILKLSGSNDYFLIFRWAPAHSGGHWAPGLLHEAHAPLSFAMPWKGSFWSILHLKF